MTDDECAEYLHELDYQENVSNVNMFIINVQILGVFMQMYSNVIVNRKSLFPMMMTVMAMHLSVTKIQTPYTFPVELK